MKRIARVIFSVFTVFCFPVTLFAQVVITEIMYDLPKDSGSDEGREWIEVLNTGSEPVDLSGWRLYEAEVNHKLKLFQGDGVLPSGGYAIIADNPGKFLADNSNFSGTVFDSSFSLKNTGEAIILRSVDLVDVDSVSYTPEMGGKGDGNSLQKVDDEWIAGAPTPGVENGSGVVPEVRSGVSDPKNVTTKGGEVAQGGAEGGGTLLSVGWPVEPHIFARIKTLPPVLVAGADVLFEGEALGLRKEPMKSARYMWTFGDGATKDGEKVLYNFKYPGTYVVMLNVSSGVYSASDRVDVEVVPADIAITSGGVGSDSFVELYNKSKYELNLSRWIIEAGGSRFVIPANTVILPAAKVKLPAQNTGLQIKKGDAVYLRYPNGAPASSYVFVQRERKVTELPPKTGVSQKSVQTPMRKTEPKKSSSKRPDTGALDNDGEREVQNIIVGANQAATVFIANEDTQRNIYKWLFAVSALALLAVLGVFFSRKDGDGKEGVSEASTYEIIEE